METRTGRTPRRAAGSREVGASSALLIRAWPEEDGLRARLLDVGDPRAIPVPFVCAQGVEAILDAVRAWLLTR
jgi:hypothetical protein